MAVVLSVGQCNYDDSRIGQVIRAEMGAFLERAGSPAQAKQMIAAKKYNLVLVNRVFDSSHEMGVDFIEQVKADAVSAETPIMLVSDHADAQASAIKAGALPGFGKSSLFTPKVAVMLKNAVSLSSENSTTPQPNP